MKKVSIIIPVYNVQDYIESCLQSVIKQVFPDFEVILIDDGSSDASAQICDDWVEKDSRFTVIHTKNRGLSAARNMGVRNATGEYLYFLDSDDELTPCAIGELYKYVEKHSNVDLVQGGFFERIEDADKPTSYCIPEYTEDQRLIKTILLTFDGDLIKAQSRLVRRDFFIDNKLWFKEGIIHEDNYWTFFLAKFVRRMCFCNRKTYYHRMNPSSITHLVNFDKECGAFKVLIETFCANIDDFLPGRQKEFILETLVCALKRRHYRSKEGKRYLIATVKKSNNVFENLLMLLYLLTKSTPILHLLIRLYKIKD